MIISTFLTAVEDKLLRVLRDHKDALGWSLANLKGIRASMCMHRILLEEGLEYYCFLDGYSGYNQIVIALEDQEKTTFTCPYGTFTFRWMPFGLCSALGTFQSYMMAIFSDMVQKTIEVFMDNFLILGNSFDNCLENLRLVLVRCEETNLVLNWEKCHFMVQEGIVLGHRISVRGIKVDKAKIEAIEKLPPPSSVKAIRSFLGHAGFYRWFIKDFS